MIDETLASIRHWLPTARIIVMCDYPRAEMRDFQVKYEQYLDALRKQHKTGVIFWEFGTHKHQIGMVRRVLPFVTTSLVLFAEHDTPLVTDRPIDFQGITDALLSGEVGCVRFLPESRVCPFHLYLYREQFESHGVPLWKCLQWSQRPHVATVELYKKAMNYFSPEANTMIEDRLATFVMNEPWEAWKVAVYNPPDSMCRSQHLDGRGTDSKFEEAMIF
jgi:hypothetical protein